MEIPAHLSQFPSHLLGSALLCVDADRFADAARRLASAASRLTALHPQFARMPRETIPGQAPSPTTAVLPFKEPTSTSQERIS